MSRMSPVLLGMTQTHAGSLSMRGLRALPGPWGVVVDVWDERHGLVTHEFQTREIKVERNARDLDPVEKLYVPTLAELMYHMREAQLAERQGEEWNTPWLMWVKQ